MKVALLKDIVNLGKRGDIKSVSDGYARNFLLKNKFAEALTPETERKLELEKEKQNKYFLDLKEKVDALKEKIKKITLVFKVKIGKSGQVFGSVTPIKIVNELKKQGIGLEKEQILSKPIKNLGENKIKIILNPGAEVYLNISVEPEDDNDNKNS